MTEAGLWIAKCAWVGAMAIAAASLPSLADAASYGRGGTLPGAGAGSFARPGDARGAYKAPTLPGRGAGDVRNNAKKQPYNYRYYSDTDRAPAACRRFAQRAIATKNANWWTRYRACLK